MHPAERVLANCELARASLTMTISRSSLCAWMLPPKRPFGGDTDRIWCDLYRRDVKPV